MGELVSHRLGNVARIGLIRSLLAESAQDFRLLLTKVVYDGTHAGDWLAVSDVEQLGTEIHRLSTFHAPDEAGEAIVRQFERQMAELVAAATRTQKPIAF